MLAAVIPTERKLALISKLASTGISSIEVTSFVRADKLPQLADAEELCRALTPRDGVRFRALYLNAKGLERALAVPHIRPEGYVLIAVSDAFSRANANTTLDEQLAELPHWIARFRERALPFERLMVSTAFGYHDDGRIPPSRTLGVIERALCVCEDAGMLPEEVTLADTTGYANPQAVRELVAGLRRRWPLVAPGLHLHDTRGTGMANVYAGLLEGVDRFDCSVGGLGGCPFAKNAAGNVPTEDVAFLCEELGIATGIDLDAYIECARLAEEIAGRPLPGRLYKAGTLNQRQTSSG